MEMPQYYNAEESEKKWQKHWEEQKIYKFNLTSKAKVYSVDTPPPTVSGKMHLGHAFSYAQQDFVIRFQRMIGKNVFYPFGTDDNGLPTERLIEQTKGIRAKDMDRQEFVKLCSDALEKELRPRYIADWKRIGISCEWTISYTTINEHCRRISQREFINMYKMNRAYRKDAFTMWCPECHTGISQVECVDKEVSSFFNDIIFKVDAEDLVIATTRPELLPACVAVFYHPGDKRYQHLKGRTAKVPLFNFEVPILEDEKADTTKGTGIVMCCTIGDQMDLEWQKAHNLPIKEAITPYGKMTKLAGKYEGMDIKTARKMIIEDLKSEGLLTAQKPIQHVVNVHERCGTEIEFIKSKQWFIKYLDLKKDMLRWGRQLNWYPKHMRNRYENWVKGLQWDWLISRQRYFGVPFPVWYCSKCDEPILADEKDLPVDPLKDNPPVKECPKCKNKGFIPEKDVLDTWATSSLTPQLAIELMPKKIQKKLFPMSLRPQAHDIVTFWLFNTTFRSNIHYGCNPWKDCMISGWALDPHGKKMSKSKGNVIEPQEMIKKYSADCLRFWAAGSKLGEDLPFQEKDLVTGQKFQTKLWNASKFVISHLQGYKGTKPKSLENMDRWLLSKLQEVIKQTTDDYKVYNFSEAKRLVEQFFWHTFCDNYLEIIKDRLYNEAKRGKNARTSAQYTLYTSMLAILKMIAPIMPHITEELYHYYFNKYEKKKSVHLTEWPKYEKKLEDKKLETVGDKAVDVINKVRQYKTQNGKSMKTEINLVLDEKELKQVLEDLKAVTNAKEISFGKTLEISF
ncbi:MAG: valine--tRNA ligase [Nanoarchaeota archaeon]|nr:valine--tRNA ligase [Nanoarchaeota archaeon]